MPKKKTANKTVVKPIKKRAYKRKKVTKVDKVVMDAQKKMKEQSIVLDKSVALGAAIHTVVNTRTSSGILNDVNDYSDPALDDRSQVVTLARRLRDKEGICASVADLLTDFAVTRGSFYCDNEELKKLLNLWADKVNLDVGTGGKKTSIRPVPGLRNVSRKAVDDYITDGDSIITAFWKKIKLGENTNFLPSTIRVLDTTSVTIDEGLAKLGVEVIQLEIDDELAGRIREPKTDAEKIAKKQIPKEWLKFINKGEPVILDPNVTYHLKRNGKDYKPWGVSFFLKAFGSVAAKRRIQAVDEATIDGLINRFTIFHLGLADKEKNPAYHIPSGRRVEQLIAILTDPKRTNAIVWPGPDLKIDDIGPDGKILEFDQKYKQADTDILRALHTSPLLIDGGSSGQQVRDWAAFISTEVGLDYIRDELTRIYTLIGEEIALTNKMEYEVLEYKFDTQLLKDEQHVRRFALDVFKLGGTSIETFVKTMGYNFEMEKLQKTKEMDEGLDEIFINRNAPGSTFRDEGGRPDDTTNDDLDKQTNEPPEETANVEIYKSVYSKLFEKIVKDVALQYKLTGNKESAKMTLLSGLSQFKSLVEMNLGEVFRVFAGGNLVKEDLGRLLKWNDGYIDNFMSVIVEAFDNDIDAFGEFIGKQKRRINLYATESFAKAKWVGLISINKIRGVTKAIWICRDSDSLCVANHNKVFNLDELIDVFPGHIGCKCELSFVRDN